MKDIQYVIKILDTKNEYVTTAFKRGITIRYNTAVGTSSAKKFTTKYRATAYIGRYFIKGAVFELARSL